MTHHHTARTPWEYVDDHARRRTPAHRWACPACGFQCTDDEINALGRAWDAEAAR